MGGPGENFIFKLAECLFNRKKSDFFAESAGSTAFFCTFGGGISFDIVSTFENLTIYILWGEILRNEPEVAFDHTTSACFFFSQCYLMQDSIPFFRLRLQTSKNSHIHQDDHCWHGGTPWTQPKCRKL
jgi:hypothetical protein